MSASDGLGIEVDRKWFRLGVAVAVVQYVFLLVLLLLLRIDVTLALAVAVFAGIAGGIAFTWFVLYVY